MRKTIFIICLFPVATANASSQELQARITVNASNISSQTDRSVFQALQNALNDFLNTRKWTRETFQPNEKINCNFLLNVIQAENNFYKATLTIQAARPVYNSTYET